MAYATVDEVLQRIGHSGATSVDLTTKITDALEAATAQIDSDTGRVFTQSTGERFFVPDMSDPYTIHLPDFRSVNSVTVDDDNDGVYETAIVAANRENGRLTDRTDWPYDRIHLLERPVPTVVRRRYLIDVDAEWGWAAVPSAINQACALLAAQVAQRASSALFGVQSFGEVGAASIRNTDPHYLSLIGPYRKPQVY